MKRVFIGAVIALLLAAGGGPAYAAEDKWIEAGFKMWVNDWTHEVPSHMENGVFIPGGSTTSDLTVLFGPAVEVKFPNRVFVDASYLFSLSDYTFSGDQTFNQTFNDSRQDVDVAIGYMIIPEFGVLAGYKSSFFKEKETGIKDTVYGPLIGMVATAPVSYSASVYGKLNYLFTRFKQTGSTSDFQEDSPGWIFEAGFKFEFTRVFSGTFGYKYETNTGNDSNVQDSFSGLIFSGMFAF
jgi:hypothetical protein